MLRTLLTCIVLTATSAVPAATLDQFSDAQLATALRGALAKGTTDAVLALGKPDGFLGNPKVRIPLPKPLKEVDGVLRQLGLGKQSDALVTAMNRAAEAAVPEAKAVVLDAIKGMTLADARAIVTGPDDAATAYFKRTTRAPLTTRLLPIVQRATAKVKLKQYYAAVVDRAAAAHLVDPKALDLDAWVTQKTLDGLYLTIADNERAIRKDPLGQANRLLQDVFGAVKR